jgi:hypothetical protein
MALPTPAARSINSASSPVQPVRVKEKNGDHRYVVGGGPVSSTVPCTGNRLISDSQLSRIPTVGAVGGYEQPDQPAHPYAYLHFIRITVGRARAR